MVCFVIKFHQFNSSVGIDGQVRKVAMIVCVGILVLAVIDRDLLAFIPEEYIQYMGIPETWDVRILLLLLQPVAVGTKEHGAATFVPSAEKSPSKLAGVPCEYDIRTA